MISPIKNYQFKTGLPHEFEILDLETLFDTAADIITSPHRAGFYHIIWFQKAIGNHLVDFISLPIVPNTVLFLNKDVIQEFDKNGGFTGKVILFTNSFFCKTAEDTNFLHNSVFFNPINNAYQIVADKELSQTLNFLLDLMNQELKAPKDSRQSNIVRNYLYNFLLLAERENEKQSSQKIVKDADFDLVVKFKILLENEYLKHNLVSTYAGKLFSTEKRLNRATKKVTGKTAKKIISERLVLEAKRLLSHSHKSVKEVGFDLGFLEPTNFVKYFKKNTGLTPTEFRDKFELG